MRKEDNKPQETPTEEQQPKPRKTFQGFSMVFLFIALAIAIGLYMLLAYLE